MSEEDLRETLKMVGPFTEFKLKVDPKTQQPKGYGFCEYKDPDVAASAIRNLNNCELKGRNLRVNFPTGDNNPKNLKEPDVIFRDKGEIVIDKNLQVEG